MHSEPESELAPLVRNLSHRDHQERLNAALTLAECGPAAASALPALVRALADAHQVVRQGVAQALLRIDPHWATNPRTLEAVPALIDALADRVTTVAQVASAILERIGAPAVSAMLEALRDEKRDLRQVQIARTLGRIRPRGEAVPAALARLISSPHPHVSQAAAEALGELGPTAQQADVALVGGLADWSDGVRLACAQALGRIQPHLEVAVPALLRVLPDRVEAVREAAVASLVQLGPEAAAPLVEALSDQIRAEGFVGQLRRWAEFLTQIGTIPERFGDDPRQMLNNIVWHEELIMEDWSHLLRRSVLIVLGRLGPAVASVAVPALVHVLNDDRRLRQSAATTLGLLGSGASAAVPALVDLLCDEQEGVRQAVAEALDLIDPNWPTAPCTSTLIPTLVEQLKSPLEGARQAARAALVRIGPIAIPILLEALRDPDRQVRQAAAEILGAIGPAARSAIPALQEAISDSHSWVREAARLALQKVETPEGPLL